MFHIIPKKQGIKLFAASLLRPIQGDTEYAESGEVKEVVHYAEDKKLGTEAAGKKDWIGRLTGG